MLAGATSDVYPAACPNGICPGLGDTFYLPRADAVSVGGHAFVRDIKLGQCATVKTTERASREMKVTSSMKKMVEDTNNEFSLSGSYTTAALTVKGSVGVKTSESTDLTTTFHATHLDIIYVTHEVNLERSASCLGGDADLDTQFVESFQSLPEIDPERVQESSSWAPYVNFLKNQGSHIMVQQSIGSRFEQWESSTSSSSDIAKTLEVKACADVEGVAGAGGWSVKSCDAYNETEKREALRTTSYTHRVISGGTDATRIGLVERLANDTLQAFLDAAPEGSQPVTYGFSPVWETLINVYNIKCIKNGADSDDCRHRQIAYNLQAAYEGWLSFECSNLETTNGLVYQEMAISDPSATIKTYQCNAAKTGCNDDNDCHIGGAGSVCYCYGPSCIDGGDELAGTVITRSTVRGDESGSYDSGVNNACYYHVGVYCNCDKNWSGGLAERQLWVQGESFDESEYSILV